MHVRIGKKITFTALAAITAAGVGLGQPVAAAPAPRLDSLQDRVNAIQATKAVVGVQAQSIGPGGSRYATAGKSDRETGEAVEAGEAYRTGSTTKTFVATVVLQLVGEGKLSLDDTVERWLPGVVKGNGNDGSKITIRQLLQHTSGIFNYTFDFPPLTDKKAFEENRFTTWTGEQLVAIAMRHRPEFPPGSKWKYSNTNYTLAGMIIEKITGRPWYQEVTRRIIQPLGLRNTSAPYDQPFIIAPHMRGYSAFPTPENPDPPVEDAIDTSDWNPSGGGAAGAMVTTTADQNRFFIALVKGELLPPAQLAEMKTTVRAEELEVVWPGARYGLGLLQASLTCGGSYWGHPGDVAGYATRNGITDDGARSVVVETTGDGTNSDLSTLRAQNALIDKELCAAPSK
ncbi:beta-lactamase family protein [Actinomadura graeca]|uniref:Beta-lactamase family protein n=1 Tax=Actinomadura graeca TaxID=2750812 RepID=A0ABX8QSX7_9ACTN|nr:serine hydrolase domain-containing protein [Actinomadura graeca]QXJ21289.1 beta-lactamase family protein [Actinomadura graeca]